MGEGRVDTAAVVTEEVVTVVVVDVRDKRDDDHAKTGSSNEARQRSMVQFYNKQKK